MARLPRAAGCRVRCAGDSPAECRLPTHATGHRPARPRGRRRVTHQQDRPVRSGDRRCRHRRRPGRARPGGARADRTRHRYRCRCVRDGRCVTPRRPPRSAQRRLPRGRGREPGPLATGRHRRPRHGLLPVGFAAAGRGRPRHSRARWPRRPPGTGRASRGAGFGRAGGRRRGPGLPRSLDRADDPGRVGEGGDPAHEDASRDRGRRVGVRIVLGSPAGDRYGSSRTSGMAARGLSARLGSGCHRADVASHVPASGSIPSWPPSR